MAHCAPACCRSLSAHLPHFRSVTVRAADVPAMAGAVAASPPASTAVAAAAATNLLIRSPRSSLAGGERVWAASLELRQTSNGYCGGPALTSETAVTGALLTR